MTRYYWYTDAAAGHIEADDIDAALALLVAQGEWAPLYSREEAESVWDGAWLVLHPLEGTEWRVLRDRFSVTAPEPDDIDPPEGGALYAACAAADHAARVTGG